MKTEMQMMPNGNYEQVVSPIQHECRLKDYVGHVIERGWELGKLFLEVEFGDPYEDGFSLKTEINYCPICGYKPEKYIDKMDREKIK